MTDREYIKQLGQILVQQSERTAQDATLIRRCQILVRDFARRFPGTIAEPNESDRLTRFDRSV